MEFASQQYLPGTFAPSSPPKPLESGRNDPINAPKRNRAITAAESMHLPETGSGMKLCTDNQSNRRSAMFENHREQMEVLLKENEEFRRLYNHHQQLEKRVIAAENGTAPMEDLALNQLKREKLKTKDHLTRLMDQHQAAA
ncbi:MAG: YdcH family protein [Wenzhouxiangellaceae bacterium]